MIIMATKDFIPGKIWSLVYHTKDHIFVVYQSNDKMECIEEKVKQANKSNFNKMVKLESLFYEFLAGFCPTESKNPNDWISLLYDEVKFIDIYKQFVSENSIFFKDTQDHMAFSNIILCGDLEIIRTRNLMQLAEKIQ